MGAAYARYSTRFQESIDDQIRSLLEYALANRIRIHRKLIFFDLAVRGAKNRRAGLDGVRQTLVSKKASALLLFATNRLFFVKSCVDTDDHERWEALLHMYAMMDQFVVRKGVAHIHAAHQGMLIKQLVYGTICFG